LRRCRLITIEITSEAREVSYKDCVVRRHTLEEGEVESERKLPDGVERDLHTLVHDISLENCEAAAARLRALLEEQAAEIEGYAKFKASVDEAIEWYGVYKP
jgi:hypothetical protein